MQKKQLNEVLVQIEYFNGNTQWGRIQIPADMGISKYFNQPTQFFILRTDMGRSLLINKNQILKIEPQEARPIDNSERAGRTPEEEETA